MEPLTVHSTETAPEAAKGMLDKVNNLYGFVPNLMGVLAEAPQVLAAYLTLSNLFESSTLTPTERHVVLLAVSHTNGCDYCMAAHSALAAMQEVPEEVISALRDGNPVGDPRLEALRTFTAELTRHRADPSRIDAEAFLAAGFTRGQLLEVILGVTQKTLSNYVNHLAGTPLDGAFEARRWSGRG